MEDEAKAVIAAASPRTSWRLRIRWGADAVAILGGLLEGETDAYFTADDVHAALSYVTTDGGEPARIIDLADAVTTVASADRAAVVGLHHLAIVAVYVRLFRAVVDGVPKRQIEARWVRHITGDDDFHIPPFNDDRDATTTVKFVRAAAPARAASAERAAPRLRDDDDDVAVHAQAAAPMQQQLQQQQQPAQHDILRQLTQLLAAHGAGAATNQTDDKASDPAGGAQTTTADVEWWMPTTFPIATFTALREKIDHDLQNLLVSIRMQYISDKTSHRRDVQAVLTILEQLLKAIAATGASNTSDAVLQVADSLLREVRMRCLFYEKGITSEAIQRRLQVDGGDDLDKAAAAVETFERGGKKGGKNGKKGGGKKGKKGTSQGQQATATGAKN